jgi:predicted acyl esterase
MPTRHCVISQAPLRHLLNKQRRMIKTSPGLAARIVDRVFQRLRKLPPPRNEYAVERGLQTPTRDGVVLVSDHYAPVDSNAGGATILIRTPYGRGLPVDADAIRARRALDLHHGRAGAA